MTYELPGYRLWSVAIWISDESRREMSFQPDRAQHRVDARMHVAELAKYSVGVGDRFECEAEAQLQACLLALAQGVEVVPVWNKSNREHEIIGSEPAGTRRAAARAVETLSWKGAYFVDADHIRLETVDRFIPHCDFYTIDVADCIGRPAEVEAVKRFAAAHPELARLERVPRGLAPLQSGPKAIEGIAGKYLLAVKQAGRIYRHIAASRAERPFVTEVSLDETDAPQTSLELLVLLAALADEAVPLQTIAPRFCGAFHKGVDYCGEVTEFERQFHDCLAVIAFAVEEYSLPRGLKLSLHSGSDKFLIYGPINRALAKFEAGLHLKTAGTTWLEEITAIAASGGEGLDFAKQLATTALTRMDELCAPYRNVVSINSGRLPSAGQIRSWSPEQFARAVRHDSRDENYSPDLRQMLHIAYKLAAERHSEFRAALESCRETVSRNVTSNLFERHLKPVFLA